MKQFYREISRKIFGQAEEKKLLLRNLFKFLTPI